MNPLTLTIASLVLGLGNLLGATAHANTDLTDAEVRKVDKDNGKLTLKHAEIKNLDMPGMTMVFQVKDPAVLDKLKAGDKVRFKATKEGGTFFASEVQVAAP